MKSIRCVVLAATTACSSVLFGWNSLAQTSPATQPTPAAAPLFKSEIIATDLRAPWALKFLPDGRVFFTERDGRVRVIEHGHLLDEPALVVKDIKSWSKMGLLGIAIDPNFPSNHFIYLDESHGTDDQHNWDRVVRYRESDHHLIEARVLRRPRPEPEFKSVRSKVGAMRWQR